MFRNILHYVTSCNATLSEILNHIENCTTEIEKQMQKLDATAQLHSVQKRLPGFILIETHSKREFVKEGEAAIVHAVHDREQVCHLFLVNMPYIL